MKTISPSERRASRESIERAKGATKFTKKPCCAICPNYWDNYFGGRYKAEYEQPTGIAREELIELTGRLTHLSRRFPHPSES